MGEDPERIEQEIERTRAKLGDDLDALEEKVNPKKVAHRSVDRAKEKVAEVKDKVVGAAGAAKEKVAGRDAAPADPARRRRRERASGGVGEKVSGLAGTAKEKAGPLAATAKEKAGPLAATAQEKAAVRSGLDPQTADTREVATAVAGSAWQTLREQTRRNPLAVGAVAFVARLAARPLRDATGAGAGSRGRLPSRSAVAAGLQRGPDQRRLQRHPHPGRHREADPPRAAPAPRRRGRVQRHLHVAGQDRQQQRGAPRPGPAAPRARPAAQTSSATPLA